MVVSWAAWKVAEMEPMMDCMTVESWAEVMEHYLDSPVVDRMAVDSASAWADDSVASLVSHLAD